MAAAVLFFSGVLIGGTLDRVSIWLLPGQSAAPNQLGQISRALEPHDIAPPRAAEKVSAAPEEKAKAEAPLTESAASPSAPHASAAREPETATSERPSIAAARPGPSPSEGKPETAEVAQPAPPRHQALRF